MKLRLFLFILAITLVFPVAAQESLWRDPASLAARYLNIDAESVVFTLPDPYEPGVTTSQFFTAKQGESQPQQVTAILGASARISAELPGALVWVEEGIDFTETEAQSAARALAAIFAQMALRSNYDEPFQLPGGQPVADPSDLMPVPDVDRDGFIHVLYMRNLADERDAIANPLDRMPAALVPGGLGNAREVIFVNTTPYVQASLDDAIYLRGIAAAFMEMLLNESAPRQAPWLRNLLITDLYQRLSGSGISPTQVDSYLDIPSSSIVHVPNFINAPQVTGGQQLFLNYLRQRFGESIVMGLFEAANEGDAALDRAIAETGMRDPVTGAVPTSGEIFSDFAAANILNGLFGDGRFAYTNAPLDPGETAAASELELDHSLKTAGMPYGVAYYFYTAPEAQTIQVQFQGAESISRFADRSGDLENRFYLADSLPDADLTLTRRVDLTDVSAAELTFDALFDLSTGWNYGYISVSLDEGETWELLPAVGDEVNNLHGAAYGPGFTGVSSPEAPRSFPIMGVVLGADGVTIGDLSPNGPAQQGGMQMGDVLIGVDGETWQTAPNILEVLSRYAPGQMVVFRVLRGDRSHEIPIMLGAHPTRAVMPESEWMPQAVDLTPYAGQEILLRFEMVTLPAYERATFAVDNLTIQAIGWRDDGDLPDDWALSGWSVVAERVPTEWMLTAVYTGNQDDRPPRVERMLMGEGFDSNFRVWLGANETLILAVSALNMNTDQSAAFELELTRAD